MTYEYPLSDARRRIEKKFDSTVPGSIAWWAVMKELNRFDAKHPNIWIKREDLEKENR